MTFRPKPFRPVAAVVFVVAIAGACCGPVFAQSMNRAQITSNDRAFVTNMLQESRAQIAVARLARNRAKSAEAASAADQTIAEWASLRSRLTAIAYEQGMPVRGTLDASQRTLLQRLGRAQPAHFDQAFLGDINRGNRTALDSMQLDHGTMDPDVQRFISYAQPIVSSHEQMTSDDILGEHSRG